MKIYQVCKEYYDMPDSTIVKTFTSRKKAENFKKDYIKSNKWYENRDDTECIVINVYEVE